ncbi:MAG: NEW3 domain-containing protein, partial [Candidatus Aenigmatarchaeota archaeon]
SARYSNISLILPSGWNSNSTLENCENLVKNQECSKSFEVEIPKKTSPGNYYVYVRTNWTNPDNSLGTNQTSLLVNITSNPLVNVSEEKISGNIPDGSEAYLANFTVLSEGNDNLQNINFNCISGIVCQDFIIKFIPENISSLLPGENQSVAVNVSVPLGYDAGTYSGIINVSAFNDGFDIFEIEVSVPINRTWSMQPEICQKSQTPPEGIACEVNVSNLGNIYINFTISPEKGNYTKVNETNFTISARSSHVFSVYYNVTGIPPNIYNSTFIVSAVEEANPKNKSLIVTLLPYVEPIIEFKIIPNETQQKNSVEFFVNVTDRSGTGILWTKLNITQPNSTLQSYDMIKTYESGNLSIWYFKYEGGNTTQRGRYNVSIYTKDNVGNIGIKNSSFIIYYYLNVFLSTLSTKYYQGDQGAIYYNVKDLNGNGIENISVEFLIKDSLGNITHYSSYKTNSEGSIYPLPTFYISSDSLLGIYNLTSITSYHDEMVNETFYVYKSYNFEVLSRTVTVTGLFADIETAVVWYPDNTMKLGILTYNGEGRPVDVNFMNLTVYRPDGLVYFTDTLANMQRKMTGFYIYERSMSPDSPNGMYLAVVNATQGEFQTLKLKAFRVARGGPYDLWVELLENEVKRGDYLDFVVTIENKGEVSQDIFLEWWVSVGNETYYYESGWFYTPGLSNQTTTKQAYIFKTQPLGTSTLTVRMTYDNIQPPLVANRTFIVLAEEVIPPNITLPELPPPPITYVYPVYIPTAAAIIPPAEGAFAEIKIVSYRENISVVRGASRVESVVVKNTGEANLENVSFLVFGIPLEWYNVTPEFYRSLPPGNTSVFLITFNIPANAKLGATRITLTALSGVVSDQKYATLTIFQSMEELLEDEIRKLKSDLALLEQDVKRAEAEGKDVSVLTSILEDIRIQISLAEENFKNNKLEDAFDNVRRARNLIDKAKDLLSKLEVKKAVFRPIIPIWLIPILISVILIPILLFLTRKKIPALRPYIIPVGRVAERVKKEEKKGEIVREREKLLRMLEVLEKEKEEGIISIAAYKEMKKNIEDKLKNIEKKLK